MRAADGKAWDVLLTHWAAGLLLAQDASATRSSLCGAYITGWAPRILVAQPWPLTGRRPEAWFAEESEAAPIVL